MQTFLIDWDPSVVGMTLDVKRAGKQRVEAMQIFLALTRPRYGWQAHPAVRQWRGHRGWLCLYGIDLCAAWRARGFRDSLLPWFAEAALGISDLAEFTPPPWWGRDDIRTSHRAVLVAKAPEFYGRLWPGVEPAAGVVWGEAA